jgi:two-component system, LytTR family, sensor kinase
LIKIKDRWFRIVVVIVPLLLNIFVSEILSHYTPNKLGRLLVTLCSIIVITEGSRYLIYNSRRWFSKSKRLLYLFLIGITGTMIILAASAIIRQSIAAGTLQTSYSLDTSINFNGKQLILGLFGYSLMNAAINFPILVLAFEMLYRSALLRYTEKEKGKLEKEKLHAELSLLKGIINPHFLFNNLNSLSSLIGEDPEKAQDFLDELTQVFRYLLRNNQTELTSLSEELKFIQTYYQLLRTRYGTGIEMTVNVDPAHHDLLLPPLTLQLLVENAVKHNRIQKNDPVRIELVSEKNNKLIVRNNIFPKEGRTESTGLGLYSINARYKILNKPELLIEKKEKEFCVTIPLINQSL